MDRESQKIEYEKDVFLKFANAANLDINLTSIEAGNHVRREPDILCSNNSGEKMGFELGRLIDPNLAKVINSRSPKNGEYIRTCDPSFKIAKKKLALTYSVKIPVNLLLYKEYPIISPDSLIIPTLNLLCEKENGYFRVWYFGDSVNLICESS